MRRFRLPLLALAATLLIAGCERADPRVKDLHVGQPKDSALVVMGAAGQRGQAYLMNGRYIEAYIIRKPGVEGPSDSLSRKQLTPVILVDGKVTGWNWKHWDSVAGANKIPVKPAK